MTMLVMVGDDDDDDADDDDDDGDDDDGDDGGRVTRCAPLFCFPCFLGCSSVHTQSL